MTPPEATALHLQEQNLASFRARGENLLRIATDGPDGTEEDDALCRTMAWTIIGDLALSAHRAKAETETEENKGNDILGSP